MVLRAYYYLIALLLCVNVKNGGGVSKRFNVLSYGAVPHGNTDNSKAFLEAWNDACEWSGSSRVWVPEGTYTLGPVIFTGPCNGPINFVIKGSLVAIIHPVDFFIDHWISFLYVDQLVVNGGGYLHGQGTSAWRYNDCATNPQCKPLPVTMRFDFITNSRINHIRSIDSKNSHFNLFACQNVNMSHIHIWAPAWSPNTDGIHIGRSSDINIRNSVISTGDDCISMIAGSQNIIVSGVRCGPGHGFSIGSLGGTQNEEQVSGIIVRNSTLHGTQNGLRIKTWAPSVPSVASSLTFDNVVMENVANPIFIDQQYCPQGPCNNQAQSLVQIRDVTFSNIRGTSSTKDAIKLLCSGLVPCQGVKLVNINLIYHGSKGPTTTSCFNVIGKSYGHQFPIGCL